MHPTLTIQSARRWLPLLLLLLALAQLATVAHQHLDDHNVADCTLCLHHTNLTALSGSHALPGLPEQVAFAPVDLDTTRATQAPFRSSAIRAPPAGSPLTFL
ncbi:hypothetical protein [Pseudomaricurvus sp.]|uniref:hypothetical protein n=1 Tax=Pseudomaricurvus sp. TaxID=2004510 RepID=UPI003F6BEAC4